MQQLDLFDQLYDDFKFTNKTIRLVEMFAGIGTQKMGFERVGIDVEVIAIVEVDKWALLSYASMHTEYLQVRDTYFETHDVDKDAMVDTLQRKNIGYNFVKGRHSITYRTGIEIVRNFWLADKLSKNLGDVSKVKGQDLPKDIDMLTYSFPCTDLSKAGQQKGLSNTRSGLVFEVFRIVDELIKLDNKPKTLLMENVVDLIQVKFIDEFHEMQKEVENFGYMNYTMRLNAKDYGVAQSRDRVFMLSLPSETNYVMPRPFKLEKRLKDYLEKEVDESYYLSDLQQSQINSWNSQQNPIETAKTHDDPFMQTLTAKGNTSLNASMLLIKEHQLTSDEVKPDAKRQLCNDILAHTDIQEYDMIRHSYTASRNEDLHRKENENGISATLTTRPDTLGVAVDYDIHKGLYLGVSDNFKREPLEEMARTLLTKGNGGVVMPNLRIRKLTPKECFRLMGIDDSYFYKADKVNSDAQLYKQAGNAIVVDVIGEIVKSLVL